MAAPSAISDGSFAWRGDGIGISKSLPYDANRTTDYLPHLPSASGHRMHPTAKQPSDSSPPSSNPATTIDSDGQGGDNESEAGPDWVAAHWRWSSLLLVRLSPTNQRKDLLSSTLVVAPNQEGLAVLHDIDAEIDSVWLVEVPAGTDSLPSTESVRKIGPWTSTAGNKRHSTALHCASGAVFAVFNERLVRVEETELNWSSGTKYRAGGRPTPI